MNTPTHDKSISALLVVDPYNDFISEGGKIWPPAILVRAAVMAAGQLGLSVGWQAHRVETAPLINRMRRIELRCDREGGGGRRGTHAPAH